MNNLIQRILTGLVAGSLVIAAIIYDAYGLMGFCALVSVLGLYEFFTLTIEEKSYRNNVMVIALLIWVGYAVVYTLGFTTEHQALIWKALPMILPLLSLFTLFQSQEQEPVKTVGSMAMGMLYCYFPFLLLFHMGLPEGVYDFRIPLGILLLTWVLDSMAYFVGRALGKNPLFARISPKKTWEGSVGGAILCIALGVAMEYYPFSSDDIGFNWIIVAAIIAVFSQLGDLVESMYKRSMSIKDSGTILPGHGGILDRFDGTYISIPFVYFYLSIIA